MDLKRTQGEPRILISRAALLHNATLIRRRLAPGTRLCAVIKSNAYGHGGDIVADTLANFSADDSDSSAADCFAVGCIDDAADLAEQRLPIMVLRPVENAFMGRQRQMIELAIRCGWTLTLTSTPAADDVARIATAAAGRAAVQIMVDPAGTHGGASLDQLDALLHRVTLRSALRLVGIAMHCTGDGMDEQVARFRAATEPFITQSNQRILRHAAGSAALLSWTEAHLDMVRPGLALYGLHPAGRPSLAVALRPALRLTAPIIAIRDGLGVLPIGYGDGYPRWAEDGVATVHGVASPVANVGIDMMTLDLTRVPHVTLGDDVTLIDPDPLSPCSAYAIARAVRTTPCELLMRLSPRLPRVAVEPDAREERLWGHNLSWTLP
jgi:alanine racemase